MQGAFHFFTVLFVRVSHQVLVTSTLAGSAGELFKLGNGPYPKTLGIPYLAALGLIPSAASRERYLQSHRGGQLDRRAAHLFLREAFGGPYPVALLRCDQMDAPVLLVRGLPLQSKRAHDIRLPFSYPGAQLTHGIDESTWPVVGGVNIVLPLAPCLGIAGTRFPLALFQRKVTLPSSFFS